MVGPFADSNRHLGVRLGACLLRRRAEHLVPSLIAGLLGGLLTITFSLSFAALVFSAALPAELPRGIGLALLSAVILNAVTALGSSVPFAVASPQSTIAVVVSLMVGSIAGTLPRAASVEVVPTVIAAIALTSAAIGVFFLSLGVSRLGRLIRFIPYPVVGGFLAGTGWLLVSGAVRVLTGLPLDPTSLRELLHGAALMHLLPGAIMAVLLLVLQRRISHGLAMPTTVLAATLLFYGVLWLTHTPLAQAGRQGWLLGPLPGTLWPPLRAGDLARIAWPTLAGQVGGALTAMLIGALGLLLNVTGLELTTRREVDAQRELRVLGVANLVAGASGGFGGFHQLTTSLLAHKAGAHSRLVGLVAAAVAGLALVAGPAVLGSIPRLALGGLLLFLGLDLLAEWVYRAWFRLARVDYAMVILITTAIAGVGMLQGVVVGLVLALLHFVWAYSRIGATRAAHSGTAYRSTVDRPPRHQQVLQEQGDQLYILQLQGYLFFGTAHSLLAQIRQRVDAPEGTPVRFIVLDFRLVSGVDASAAQSLTRLRDLARQHDISLVLVDLAPVLRRQMEHNGFTTGPDSAVSIFPDLDHGVEWCEEQILTASGVAAGAQRPLVEQLAALLPTVPAGLAPRLMGYLERLAVPAGHVLLRQGAPADALYFVESGRLTVLLDGPDGRPVRLRTFEAGTVIGELGFYLGTPRTASVVAQQASVVYRLTRRRLQQMKTHDPDVALGCQELVVRLLAARVVTTTAMVTALLQ